MAACWTGSGAPSTGARFCHPSIVSSPPCRACLVAPAARVHPGRTRQPSFPDHPFSPQMRVGLGRSRRPLRHLDRPARPSILTAQDGGAALSMHVVLAGAGEAGVGCPRCTARARPAQCRCVHLPKVRGPIRGPLAGRACPDLSLETCGPSSERSLLTCSTETVARPLSVHPKVREARQRVVRMELFAGSRRWCGMVA